MPGAKPRLSSGADSLTQHNRHIHWYERLYPLGANQTIDTASVVNNNTYIANNGKSITHIINGMAGNIESHSEFSEGQGLTNITAVLDTVHYGFSKLTVKSETEVKWQFIRGDDGSVGDEVTLLKPSAVKAKGKGKGNGKAYSGFRA